AGQLVDTNTKPDLEEAPSKAEESQPFGSRVLLMTGEFETSEPSGTRNISSYYLVSSDSTALLSHDPPLTHVSPTPTPTRVSFHRKITCIAVRTQPTLSLAMSARIPEASALSLSSFCKRYRSSYETPSPSSSLTLSVRKRYNSTSELILDIDNDKGQGLEDEGLGLEEEEVVPEGHQQAVPVMETAASKPFGLGYGALRHRELAGAVRVSAFRQPTLDIWVDPEDDRVYTDVSAYVPLVAPVQTPPSPEWSLSSLPVSPSSLVVPSPIASSVATSVTTISRLDALPPTLFEGYARDLRELYTRSGAIKDEIFSQRYRFRSLEWEQERATITFSAIWRPRENHDLRRHLTKERRERLEVTNRIARMERRQESGGE
nr:hypothetical protein [Tanacetum cinerariifolium]